jgi:choline dehydrogenase
VGGGTGGCLIAGRLSENFNVLLLEEGGSPVPATYNPFLVPFISSHPAINNLFTSVPQHHFSQERGKIVTIPTGKMLGGSGSHNGLGYNRGSPHDWSLFAKVTGDDSWQYKNVLKHFKSMENYIGKLFGNERKRKGCLSTQQSI